MVTHRTALLDMVDRIVVMDGGTIVMDGPKDEVLHALKQGKVKGAG
jgi:ATP-binding cassette subfamily C protein LapB